jgi:hypothetical protein
MPPPAAIQVAAIAVLMKHIFMFMTVLLSSVVLWWCAPPTLEPGSGRFTRADRTGHKYVTALG